MEAVVSVLPETASLQLVLRGLLRAAAGEVVARRTNDWSSSHPSEIVAFRTDDGLVQLLCKYQRPDGSRGHGHRGGVAYESRVYERVLASSGCVAPHFFGAHVDSTTGAAWLVVEFIEGGETADEVSDFDDPLIAAARWAGRFHASVDTRVRSEDFLIAYDADYFAQWARRTALFTEPWHAQLPWLPALCRRAEDLADQQATVPPTVIHGEFTPSNIVVDGHAVYPVDWESAAIAMGEIDLVALVHKWPSELAARCQDDIGARWSDGPPADLARRLDLARLYWEMRWLGDRPEWLEQARLRAQVNDLRAIGARLGLVEEEEDA